MADFFGLSAFLAAFAAFLAGAADDFVAEDDSAAVEVEAFGGAVLAALAVARDAAVLPAVLVVRGLAAELELEFVDSPLAASLSDLTAVSRALVAVPIAVSALVSAFADEPAWLAAVLSLVAAVDTLVAAAVTVRGVTAPVRLAETAAVLLAAVRPAPFLLAAVLVAPDRVAAGLLAVDLAAVDRVVDDLVALLPFLLAAVRLPAVLLLEVGRAAARVLAAVAGLAAVARVAVGLLAAFVVPGVVAVVFVGTDLPPDMDQLRACHSTERNLLHLMTRKNNGETGIFVTIGHASPVGTSPPTIRTASSGVAPRPTATPMR